MVCNHQRLQPQLEMVVLVEVNEDYMVLWVQELLDRVILAVHQHILHQQAAVVELLMVEIMELLLFLVLVVMDYFQLLQELNSNIVEVVEEEVIQQEEFLMELAEAAVVVAADMRPIQQKMDLLIEVAVAEVKSLQMSMVL